WGDFLAVMYGNRPDRWDDALTGDDRLRAIVNILTRIRYVTADGRLDFTETAAPAAAAPGLIPWFEVTPRRTANRTVVFGHWSTLGLVDRPNLIALDTGCVWGGCLSARRLETRALFQQRCPQAASAPS
ncbi:MAG: diadenosine tetraphosphatase, partial [Lautropia sp.]